MMKYQLTRFGEGFIERPQMSLSVALEKLRTKLRRIDGPYEINDGPKIARDEVIRRLKVQFSNSKDQPLRFVINGDSYDQPMWVIRSVIAVVPEDPLITWGKRYLGASPYVFGTAGPPGPSDCSGFTQSAVQAVHGITLPHSAALQRQDDRFWIFQDRDDLQQGDFLWTNYGRLSWPTPDHVELYDSGARMLGSRPSTQGVNWFTYDSYDWSRVVAMGRLRT